MRIPLVDLRASLEPIRSQLLDELSAILDGMQLLLGPTMQAFEREFAEYCQVPHGVAVSNGSDALFVALKALQIGPGDEVVLPSHTFFATIAAVVRSGAVPVLVDIEPATMTIDPARIPAALTAATKAILPVHLYGHPADMDPILELAGERRLRVIEDCAQAHGARYKGRRCGSMGDAGTFSFYFTKNLGAFGEGGFVTTRHAEVAERIRQYRHQGHSSKHEHIRIGYNLRPDELQAAVLRLKLPRLDENNHRRQAIARHYDRELAGAPLRRLDVRPDCDAVYHLYPIRCDDRDALQAHLTEQGIGTGIHYKIAGHRQPALKDHPHRYGDLPVTEEVCRQLLSVPMYPELTDAQLNHICGSAREFFGRGPANHANHANDVKEI